MGHSHLHTSFDHFDTQWAQKNSDPTAGPLSMKKPKPTILAALDSDFAWRLVVCMFWGRVCVVIEITGIADLDGLWSWLHLELNQQSDANADEHLPPVELIGDQKNNKQQQPERDRELFHADSVKG
jgi:hypothetical protein